MYVNGMSNRDIENHLRDIDEWKLSLASSAELRIKYYQLFQNGNYNHYPILFLDGKRFEASDGRPEVVVRNANSRRCGIPLGRVSENMKQKISTDSEIVGNKLGGAIDLFQISVPFMRYKIF